jgi:probable phosphoglycerate mutase
VPDDPAAALSDPQRTVATRLLVIRHGETTWGAEGKFAGRQDVPLTPRGRRQASSAAQRLRRLAPVAVLTSPLQRCRLTAEAIAGAVGAEVLVRDELLDGTLGEWTGFTAAEIESGWRAEFTAWRSDPDATPPGGESFTAIRQRVQPLLAEVTRRYRGRTVVLVTHAATAKMILAWALDAPSEVAYRVRIDTASLTGISIDDDGMTMVWTVNETGHLPD